MEEKRERKLNFDLLRILAAFSVVMLHSAAQFWYDLDIYSTEWAVANSYDALFRFGVPVFVMISGALFLDKAVQIDVKRLYKHNILRMVIIYAVWSCLYGLFDCKNLDIAVVGWKVVVREMLYGRYHLWFLPMIIGIYLILPVLKSWLSNADKRTIEYFLLLFVVLQVGRETLRALTVTDELHLILDLVDVEMVCSYLGYFVWGYYLTHIGISERLRKIVYGLAVPAVVCNVVLGTVLSRRAGVPDGRLFDSYGLFTFIIVTALFVLTINKGVGMKCSFKAGRIIKEISADTLGIYLLHVGLMEGIQPYGIHSMMLPNVVGIPLFAVLCFGVCMVVAAILRRIPVIGKYLC